MRSMMILLSFILVTTPLFAADKLKLSETVIYATKPDYIEHCKALGWKVISDIYFKPCGSFGKGVTINRKKMSNEGIFTKIKGGFFFPTTYVLTEDIAKGSRAYSGVACPYFDDALNLREARASDDIDAMIAILNNTTCSTQSANFFDGPIIDRLKGYTSGSTYDRLVARYIKGDKWWSEN